jgi:hypothetical protein
LTILHAELHFMLGPWSLVTSHLSMGCFCEPIAINGQ